MSKDEKFKDKLKDEAESLLREFLTTRDELESIQKARREAILLSIPIILAVLLRVFMMYRVEASSSETIWSIMWFSYFSWGEIAALKNSVLLLTLKATPGQWETAMWLFNLWDFTFGILLGIVISYIFAINPLTKKFSKMKERVVELIEKIKTLPDSEKEKGGKNDE